jgi:hypothetical protein
MNRIHPRKQLETIARKHLDIQTLQTRKSDSLDFHEVSVWGLLAALQAAYDAGRASVKPATPDLPPDLPSAMREALSPHAVALIAAKCQPHYGRGEVGQAAEREVTWFTEQLVGMLGTDEYNRNCEELGV